MSGKRTRSIRPIGCELADGWVRMAQLQGEGQDAHVIADAVCVPQVPGAAPDVTAMRDAIRTLCRRNRFGSQQAVLALPDRLLWHRSVRVAPMPEGDLPNATHFAIAREAQFDPETFTSGIVSVNRIQESEKPRLEVLAYGATAADVEQQANLLMRSGLEPIAAEPAPYAAIRAARRMVAEMDESSRAFALVRVGACRTTIFVVCDGMVRTIHALNYGLDRAYSRAEAPENNTGARSPERAEQQLRLELATLGRQIGQEASLLIQHQRRLNGGLHVPGLVLDTTAGDLLTDAIAMQCGLDVLPLTRLAVTSRSVEHDELCGGAEGWLACIGAALACEDQQERRDAA